MKGGEGGVVGWEEEEGEDGNGDWGRGAENAQMSTTCRPVGLEILSRCEGWRWVNALARKGMIVVGMKGG